jgi:hypothetical protein
LCRNERHIPSPSAFFPFIICAAIDSQEGTQQAIPKPIEGKAVSVADPVRLVGPLPNAQHFAQE